MNEIAEQIVEIRKCQDALRMLPPGVRENETDPLAGQLERLQRASPRRSARPGMVLGEALSIAMLAARNPARRATALRLHPGACRHGLARPPQLLPLAGWPRRGGRFARLLGHRKYRREHEAEADRLGLLLGDSRLRDQFAPGALQQRCVNGIAPLLHIERPLPPGTADDKTGRYDLPGVRSESNNLLRLVSSQVGP